MKINGQMLQLSHSPSISLGGILLSAFFYLMKSSIKVFTVCQSTHLWVSISKGCLLGGDTHIITNSVKIGFRNRLILVLHTRFVHITSRMNQNCD